MKGKHLISQTGVITSLGTRTNVGYNFAVCRLTMKNVNIGHLDNFLLYNMVSILNENLGVVHKWFLFSDTIQYFCTTHMRLYLSPQEENLCLISVPNSKMHLDTNSCIQVCMRARGIYDLKQRGVVSCLIV